VISSGLLLWLISGDCALARIAPKVGIERILVDLERLGKAERQKGKQLFLSDYGWDDIAALRPVLPKACLFVRLDPLHDGSRAQVEQAIALDVDGIMLPYFHDADTVLRFAELVAGRAPVVPLVETLGAVRSLPVLLRSGVIEEFHVGLNDLALDMGLNSLQQLWGHPILDEVAAAAADAGIPFGIGGATDPRLSGLPIDPVFVIAEQRRLQSTRALLGRSFRLAFGEQPDAAAVLAATDAIRQAYRSAVPAAEPKPSAPQPAL
jgi:hypothetical protein